MQPSTSNGAGSTSDAQARPIRWLLMASHVPADLRGGGIVRYTVELAGALAMRDDIELSLLTSVEAAEPLRKIVGSRDRILQLPSFPPTMQPIMERFLLARRLNGHFDVVQGTKHLIPAGVSAHTVLTVHDMLLFDRSRDFPIPKRLLLKQPYAASLRQADRLLCVSAATASRLREWDPRLAERLTVVPLATSGALLSSKALPISSLERRPFALVVGDPSPRKNLSVVISAWNRVVKERPDAALVLVGPPAWGTESHGPQYWTLKESGHLIQLVGVDDGVLRWCYENARVVLAPSLAEGFGLPAAEALDFGAPLVTSLDPALVEVSGDAAEHVPAADIQGWADAVLRHLHNPRSMPGVRSNSRTWADVAEETVLAVAERRGK